MKNFTTISCLLLVFSFGCQGKLDKEVVTKEKLVGDWSLVFAKRRDKATDTMNGATFQFTEETMTTNWYGTDATESYILGDGIITTNDQKIAYKVERWSQDSLVLTTNYRNYPFYFVLTRALKN